MFSFHALYSRAAVKNGPPSKTDVLDPLEETMPEETMPEGAAPPAPNRSPLFPRGTNIRRHFILDRIGEGGMGVVYAAYDAELDRKVALKFLHPERAPGDRYKVRLLGEAASGLARAERRGASSQRAVASALEALTAFSMMRADREIGHAATYLPRSGRR